MRIRINLLILFQILFCIVPSKKVFSQTDTQFWFSVPEVNRYHSGGSGNTNFTNNGTPVYLHLTTFDKAADVTISMPANAAYFTPINVSIPANTTQRINLSSYVQGYPNTANPFRYTSIENVLFWTSSNTAAAKPYINKNNKGILIESTNNITAYYEIGVLYNMDLIALKGRNALGTDFYVPFQNTNDTRSYPYWFRPYSSIDIVATENDTKIKIYAPKPIWVKGEGSKPAGWQTIWLNAGETAIITPYKDNGYTNASGYYNTSFSKDDRLSGAIVEVDQTEGSGAPISIISHDDIVSSNFSSNPDYVTDQLVPIDHIGTDYAIIQGIGYSTTEIEDWVYVLGTVASTNVSVKMGPAGVASNYTIEAGETAAISMNNADYKVATIKSDQPVYVYHMSGTGRQKAGAIIPTLSSCTGSYRVAFNRTKASPYMFYLNILAWQSGLGKFRLLKNNVEVTSAAEVAVINAINNAANFSSLPETVTPYDNWRYTRIDASGLDPNVAYTLINTENIFHLGVLNGYTDNDAFYGYFSNYNTFEPFATAGESANSAIKLCYGESTQLNAHGGAKYSWSPTTFLDNPDSPNPNVINPTATTKYTVTVSGACNLSKTADVTVLVGEPLNPSFKADTLSGCGTVTVNFENTSSGANKLYWYVMLDSTGLWELKKINDLTILPEDHFFNNTFINNSDSTQNYIIKLIASNNLCTKEAIHNITVHPTPYINLGEDKSICNGESTILDAENTGSSFDWSTGATTQTINVKETGTYSVTVTNEHECASTDQINIFVNNEITITSQPVSTVKCTGDNVIFSITANGTNITYQWKKDGEALPNETFSNLIISSVDKDNEGAYSCTVSGSCGTEISTVAILTVLEPPLIISQSTDKSVELGQSTSLSVNASGNKLTYQWKKNGVSLTDNGETFGSLTSILTISNSKLSDSGNYTCEITNNCATVISDVIKLNVYETPVVNLGEDKTICQGESIILDAKNEGSTYLWSNGETTQTISVSSSGSYSVTVTNSTGYQDSDDIHLTVNPLPVVNLGYNKAICQGESVTIDAGNDGATYLWNNGETTKTINTTEQGVYSVSVTDANGCVNSDDIQVIVNPLPTVNLDDDRAICQGESVTLDAGNDGATYLWNNGETNKTVNTTEQGIYSVSVTDANGCVNSDDIQVTVNPLPAVNLGDDKAICQGESVTIDAGDDGTTYLWSNGETTKTINATAQGVYSVSVNDANGCLNSDDIQVTVNSLPTINLGDDRAICQGESVTIDAGNDGATYLWNNGETSKTINVAEQGNYSVTVTNTNNCIASDEINIIVNSNPIVNLGNDIQKCPEQNITLNAGNDDASFLWSTGETSQQINLIEIGSYSVSVTNQQGCSSSDEVSVSNYSSPIINLGEDKTSCEGEVIVLDAENPNCTYLWNTGATSQTINISLSGIYSVEITDLNGCKASDNINVTFNAKPIVNLGDNTQYTSTPLVLDPGSNFTNYLWQDGSTNQTFTVTETGSYSVAATDIYGCSGYDEVYVIWEQMQDIVISKLLTPTSGCSNNQTSHVSVELKNIGNNTYPTGDSVFVYYSINSKMPTIEGVFFNSDFAPSNTITYTFDQEENFENGLSQINLKTIVHGNHGIQNTYSVDIYPSPSINLGPDTIHSSLPHTLMSGIGNVSYLWSTGATTPSITVSQYGKYWLTATNSYGCADSDTVVIWWPTSADVVSGIEAKVKLFPNPVRDELNVWIESTKEEIYSLELINPIGLIVYKQLTSKSEKVTDVIAMNNYPSGVYLLRISTQKGSAVFKIIVNR
ncbi:MAG: immunoglobulin domain-containing protein [Bacteroidales bacterium]